MASPSLKYSKSSPSIPQTLDVTEIVTPAVSVDDFGGGPNGAQQTEENATNFVWPSINVDMRYEKSRIKSFGENWPHASIEPEKLARAGFFRINDVEEHVQCPFCGLKLNDLELEMDPEKEHRRWQPSCPFMQDLPCGNVPLGYHEVDSDEGNEVQKGALCIVCGGDLKNLGSDQKDPWIDHAERYPHCPLLQEEREQFVKMAQGQNSGTEQVEKLEDKRFSGVQPSDSVSELESECQKEQENEDVYEQFGVDCYHMGNKRRGKFLILSNDQCDNNAHVPQNYSSDLKNSINVFAQLNFEVFLYENLTYTDLISLLQTVSQEDHSNVDCFGVTLFINDSKNIQNYNKDNFECDFYSIFSGNACPSLEGKPKLFFFNVYNYHGSRKALQAPPESDFLAVFTSVSDKDSSEGELTSRVRNLYEDLRVNGMKKEDVASILGRAGYTCETDATRNENCSYTSSLGKRLFFPPKKR